MEKNDLSCEPMDIDLSSQSMKMIDVSEMDISDIDLTDNTMQTSLRTSVSPLPDQQYPSKSSSGTEVIVKKFHINMPVHPKSRNKSLLKIIAAVVTFLISLITYNMYSTQCSDRLNLDIFAATLSTRLYGQTAAINLIIKTLETKANSKILFFSGGTGVGKTLTSSLLIETVDPGSNVYHYTMPSFRSIFSTDLMFGLTMCKTSLIIVDDLTTNDMDVREQIKSVIEKSESLGKEIIVILIFNCNESSENFGKRCDKSFKSRLLENFSLIKALKSYVQFEPLSEVHLKQCIKQELGDRKLNYLDFNNVLKNFNVSLDGCKGVHSKMKYLISV